MINQRRIWKTVSGNKMSAVVTAVELIGKAEIDKRNEVEREIMTFLSNGSH